MPYTPKKRIRLVPNFDRMLARLAPQKDVSLRAFAKLAHVSYATLQANVNPGQQPGQRNPEGGMYERTAWKIATAWAELTEQTPEQAYSQIIIEVEEKGEETESAQPVVA